MSEAVILEQMEKLVASFLGAAGARRVALTLQYIRLKDQLEDVRAGREMAPVADGT